MGTAAAGSGIVFGSGAFTQVQAERDLTIGIDDDSEALLALVADNQDIASVYESSSSGELVINTDVLDDGDRSTDGAGFNVGSTVQIGQTTDATFGKKVSSSEYAFKLVNNFADDTDASDDATSSSSGGFDGELDVAIDLTAFNPDEDEKDATVNFVATRSGGGGQIAFAGERTVFDDVAPDEEIYIAIRIDTDSPGTSPDDLSGDVVFQAGSDLTADDFPTEQQNEPSEGKILNVNTGNEVSDLTTAVDNAEPYDTLRVGTGTFESVTIDTEGLTLEGDGNSASGTVLKASSSGSGNGITVDASNLTVRDLRITDYSNGIRLKNTQSNVVFENVDSVGNSVRGMEVPNSADFENLVLDNVNFSNNTGDGMRGATTSSIDGLTITDSSFNDNSNDDSSGIEVYNSESSPGQLNDVVIKNTEFIDNGQKGIYTEKLSNAIIENVTVDGVISDTNGFNTGIDINLKYNDYENITIRDSTVANVSEGDPYKNNPSFSAAIAVKARDDPTGYDDNPATLDDVTIENVVIEDSFNGLRIGEPGVDYSGAPQGPTNVTITDSTFQNVTGYYVEDVPGDLDLNAVLNNLGNTFDPAGTVDNNQIVEE